jgi:hypothetical protein
LLQQAPKGCGSGLLVGATILQSHAQGRGTTTEFALGQFQADALVLANQAGIASESNHCT